jgi:hypothetical protein
MLKSWRFWTGLLISLVCLYLAFQGIRLDQVADAIREIDPLWLIPAVGLFLVSYSARVLRWQLLFWPQKMRLKQVFDVFNIGYFLSNILPARAGDLIRPVLIGDIERVGLARALPTVVIERMSDGLTVVLLLGATALFVPSIPAEVRQGAVVTAVAGVAAVALLLLLTIQRQRGMGLVRRLAAPIPFLQRPGLWQALESLIDGFAVLRSPRPVVGVILWSLCAWVLGGLLFWSIMRAMHLAEPIPAAFLVMTVTSLGVVVPSSPGYVGVFHFLTQWTLTSVYGVDKASALSYALVMHAFNYLWILALGLYSIWQEGLTYERLQHLQATPTQEAD